MTGTDLRVAIIADDLTGALDSAAPFARRGLDVHVLTAPDDIEQIVLAPPQVLSINSNTRHLAPENASKVVDDLVSRLVTFRPELFVKKIDSTLRGNVVEETAAAMQAAGYQEVLVCPAIPSQGRTFRNGELYIDWIPLGRTAVGRDLRSAPPTAPLQDLFQALLPEISIQQENISTLYSKNRPNTCPTIRLVDAESDEQLLTLARLTAEHRSSTLFAGASGLTEALAEILLGPSLLPDESESYPGVNLFVVGSRAPQALAQIETLKASDSDIRVIELRGAEPLTAIELENIKADCQNYSTIVLRAPQSSTEIAHDSDQVARALADSVAGLMHYAPVRFLLATGGDTALAILHVLNVKVISVCGEICPGVVNSVIESKKGSLRLVTKAGAFGDDKLFCTVRDYYQ